MAIDYSSLQAQLNLSPLHEGIRSAQIFKAQSEARDQAQARFEQEAAQDAELRRRQGAFRAAYADAIDNPSQVKFDSLRANFPEEAQAIDSSWKSYNSVQQHDMLTGATSIVSALTNNAPELALRVLDTRIAALRRNNVDTTESEAIRKMIASGDPVQMRAARGIAGMVMAQATGDNFDRVWSNISQVQREQDLQPEKLRAAKADADFKETRAKFAPRQEQATIEGKTARAENARSLRARRDSRVPAGNSSGPGSPPKPAASARRPAGASAVRTATGPNGEKMVLRGNQWVRVK